MKPLIMLKIGPSVEIFKGNWVIAAWRTADREMVILIRSKVKAEQTLIILGLQHDKKYQISKSKYQSEDGDLFIWGIGEFLMYSRSRFEVLFPEILPDVSLE